MLERLAITVVLILAGAIAYQILIRWQIHQVAAQTADPLLDDAPRVPTVVYFTTETCGPCKTQQTPTLNLLKTELGDNLHIVRVDAETDPDAASRWGVMTVPTLFVLNADGTPRKVYNGVVSASTLKQDLHIAS
jgi:thioredoxin-like negative regulator of GroEL